MKTKTKVIIAVSSIVVCLGVAFALVGAPLLFGQKTAPVTGLQLVEGAHYYYDEEGNLLVGLQTIGGKLYYFDEITGKATLGWFTSPEGDTYYFGAEGFALTDKQTILGTVYTFDETGKLVVDDAQSGYKWEIVNGSYYCVGPDGEYVKGLASVEGALYLFDDDGLRQTGWQEINANKYYFSKQNGRAVRGWFTDPDTQTKYYFSEEGFALTGKQEIDGKSYNFGDDGKLVVEAAKPGQTKPTSPSSSSKAPSTAQPQPAPEPTPVEVKPDNSLKTTEAGLVLLDKNGAPATGLAIVDGKLYYGGANGVCQSGLLAVNGQTYLFDVATKAAAQGWGKNPANENEHYYFGGNNAAVKGLQQIDSQRYYFDESGKRQSGMQTIDGLLYSFTAANNAAHIGWYTSASPRTLADNTAASPRTLAANNAAASYYFCDEGYAVKGVHNIDGKYYGFGDTFVQLYGWQALNEKRYLFDGEKGAALLGWVQEGESQYYLGGEGYAISGTAVLKNSADQDALYSFDVNGVLQSGWRTVDGKKYNFAGERNEALKNKWDADGSAAHYLGTDGAALVGLQTIEEKVYYFDASATRQSGWATVEKRTYLFGDDGVALNGWQNDEAGNIFYLGSEHFALTGAHAIEGEVYAFASNGAQLSGWQTVAGKKYLLNGDKSEAHIGWYTDATYNYYFGQDGAAVTGLAKIGADSSLYYFDKGGLRQTGWQTVAGKRYYFNGETAIAQSGWFNDISTKGVHYFGAEGNALTGAQTIENINYLFDANGRLKTDDGLGNSAWVQQDGNFYYVGADDNYLIGLQVIAGDLFYFDNTGARKNGLQTINSRLYSFTGTDDKAITGWHLENDANYYFNVEGFAQTGLSFIDTAWYYFESNGVRQTGEQLVGGKYYYFDAASGGKAHKGWKTAQDASGERYYGENGFALTGHSEIDGDMYLFNATGIRQAGWQTVNGKRAYFNTDTGKGVKGWLTEADGSTFYMDENGFAVIGLKTVDSGIYYFDKTGLRLSGWQMIADRRYYFDPMLGKAVIGRFTDPDDNSVYYFADDGNALVGTHEMSGKTYIFDTDGKLVYEAATKPHAWIEENGKVYYKDSAGDVYTGLHVIDGARYYLSEEDGGARQIGWATIEGKRYFFDEDGKALRGWYTAGADSFYLHDVDNYALTGAQKIGDIDYEFAEDGKLVNGQVPKYSQWEEKADGWYYIDSTGKYVHGLAAVEGEVYLFDDAGVRQTGRQVFENYIYYFTGEKDAALKGWQQLEDGRWILLDKTSGAQQLGWQYRPVENAPTLTYYYAEGGTSPIGFTTLNNVKRYFFADGAMATGWHTIEEDKYYFFQNGRMATGATAIEGVQYSFSEDGKLATGWNVDEDGNRYYFLDEGGACKGWNLLDDKWYYFDESNGIQKLGWQNRSDAGKTYKYFYKEDGTMPEGWEIVGGVNCYFFADGAMATGWQRVEDALYFFNENGSFAAGKTLIDGVWYPFEANGHLQTGRQVIEGSIYYFTDAGAAKGWLEIDGVWRRFDERNAVQLLGMQTRTAGSEKYDYYFDDEGQPTIGWAQISGNKLYFLANGVKATGWQKIDEKDYYFVPPTGKMATGTITIDGKLYSFDADGQQIIGWNTDALGRKYYFTSNGAAKGWTQIALEEGKQARWYMFDSQSGIQLTGWIANGSKWFYFDSDGNLPEAGWNQSIDDKKRYILADGEIAQGWQDIVGVRYRFTTNAQGSAGLLLTGWQQIDGKWYSLNAQTGAQLLGWQSRNVNASYTARYYYFADGTLPAAGWVSTVEGKLRYVSEDGQMAQGWKSIANASYYFASDGTYLTGKQLISGKEHTFDSKGRLVTAPVISLVENDTGWGAEKEVRVFAAANAILENRVLQYSFNGGHTWQAGSSKKFAAGTVLAIGMIQVRDSVGNVTKYGAAVSLASAMGKIGGIDVSAHQGLIDWRAVKASGQVEFANIKSLGWSKSARNPKTGGLGYYVIDPYFDYNIRNAKANGIKVGTYLYSYAFNEAQMQEEINFFLSSNEIKKLMAEGIWFDLPVFIDYEDKLIIDNTTHLTINQRTNIVRYGMVLIEQESVKRFGVKMLPGFYTGYNFAKTAINGAALQSEGYEFWVARYNVAHGWAPQPAIWQYTSTARLPGINTNVDMNWMYKDYSAIINGGKIPAPVQSHSLTVTDQNGTIRTDAAATILAQIVQAEVGGFGNEEVFKAQAVAAQSWIFFQQSQGYNAPSVVLGSPTAAVQNAVNKVVKETMVYNGAAAFTPYYAYSNGTTNSGSYWGNTYPYLQSVNSSWDKDKATYTGRISYGDLKARIEAVYGAGYTNGHAPANWIKITSRNAAGYVTGVSVCGRFPTVDYFYQTIIRYDNGAGKNVYPIGSPSFTMDFNGSNMWTFTSSGYGHGVGMSQYGASRMASGGSTYKQILAHYYPGTLITNVS